MTQIDYAHLPNVTAAINYIDKAVDKPEFYLFDPESGSRPPPPKVDKRQMSIYDLRRCMSLVSLDDNGFSFTLQHLAELNYHDQTMVRNEYYPMCAKLVQSATGCREVYAFDHNVRETNERTEGVFPPVRNAHNDYTDESAPIRVRELMNERADALLSKRYAFINVWRPLRGPVDTRPLAICDAKSIHTTDFISADLRFPDRNGKIFSVRHNENHRWYYLGAMQNDEIMLIKCFDSVGGEIAKYTAHTSFHEPCDQQVAKGRKSIEVRTIAFF